MSDFQLDVDSPYERPTREGLMMKPRKLHYSQERIAFKHYGKYVAHTLRALRDEQNQEALDVAIGSIARYMRSKSFEYNQEHPNNEIIIKDIKIMSEGGIKLDEVALNNLRSDYKQHLSPRQTKPQLKGNAKPQQGKNHPSQKNRNLKQAAKR
jgi:hypothetical protein